MTVRKLDDGKKNPWLCDVYPQGRNGKRVRKRFATKGDALSYEKFIIIETNDKPWIAEKRDNRKLSTLIDLWFELHGKHLKSGKRAKARLHFVCNLMLDPVAETLTQADFVQYRAYRRTAGYHKMHAGKELSPASHNYDLSLVQAVFNFLIEIKEWKQPNPLKGLKYIKRSEKELAFLSHDQIKTLFRGAEESILSEQLLTIYKICLSTGARIMEAVTLKSSQVAAHKITFTDTKGKKNRTIPISPELYDEIQLHCKPNQQGKVFTCAYGVCRKWLVKALPDLPHGQATHVLRHTFASHFMMNGGNILVLQKILGHAAIKDTMIYAHFSPDHLIESLKLNPLATLKK